MNAAFALVYVIITVSGHYAGFIGPVQMSIDVCKAQVGQMQARAEVAAAAMGPIHYTIKLTCEVREKRPEAG